MVSGAFNLHVCVGVRQGQEPVAEKIVEKASKNGEWGFLQNIHLTAGWTESYLEKRCEALDTGSLPALSTTLRWRGRRG
jgi:hypothetical protein